MAGNGSRSAAGSGTVSVAGRVSYSALLISLGANLLNEPGAEKVRANFWDYQARVVHTMLEAGQTAAARRKAGELVRLFRASEARERGDLSPERARQMARSVRHAPNATAPASCGGCSSRCSGSL